MEKEKHDGFKYAKPDAPTESGLYWPEMADTMWSYCYYLGSWVSRPDARGEQEKYDLGVWVPRNGYDERGVSDATVYCDHNYISGQICIPTNLGYHSGDRYGWQEDSHYKEVLKRALKFGFKVRAWHEGPVVGEVQGIQRRKDNLRRN